jgi:hypothetical protein
MSAAVRDHPHAVLPSIEVTFEVGRRFRCTMRVDCGQLDPAVVILPVPANGARVCPSALTERSWRAGRSAVYQLAA